MPKLNASLPATQWLPTMYDLPSEDLEEPGLPDEFHALQPQLLSRTLSLTAYTRDRCFTGSDMNLYYDANHPRWHKRPDWFLVVDVPRLYRQQALRNSYVVWDEGKVPSVIVELLSPGRETDDLGVYVEEPMEAAQPADLLPYTLEEDGSGISPPHKWEAYEQILQVPYYLVFSRYTDRLRCFRLMDGRYDEQALEVENPRAWLPDLNIGLGVWQGEFAGISRAWLRWYDAAGNWLLTDTEQAEQQAAAARQKQQQLVETLKALAPEQLEALGIDLQALE